MPISVGKKADSAVCFILPVSFFIVSRVVAQGQWKSEKNITLNRVKVSQPDCMKIWVKSPPLTEKVFR